MQSSAISPVSWVPSDILAEILRYQTWLLSLVALRGLSKQFLEYLKQFPARGYVNCRSAVFSAQSDLSRWSFNDVDLSYANLTAVDLRSATFSRACLANAIFRDACLQEANMEQINAVGANFVGAKLEGANLQGADLRGATLKSANLRHADLRGAKIGNSHSRFRGRGNGVSTDITEADFTNANLKGSKWFSNSLFGKDFQSMINVFGWEVSVHNDKLKLTAHHKVLRHAIIEDLLVKMRQLRVPALAYEILINAKKVFYPKEQLANNPLTLFSSHQSVEVAQLLLDEAIEQSRPVVTNVALSPSQ